MASPVFHNCGESPYRLVFENSSAEDILDAKLFWESLQLTPQHESRLVLNDVQQRLKIATNNKQKDGC